MTQVVQDGGEHLFGLVCSLAGSGAFPAPGRLQQQVPDASQHDRVVEDVGGGSPVPFFAQLPAKLPHERTAAGQALICIRAKVRARSRMLRVSPNIGCPASSRSSACVTSNPTMSELQPDFDTCRYVIR